jgi:exodeoxyribonuclease-3
MTLRIATWNVNSLRQRLDHLARFVAETAPDVICLQEIKVRNEDFPKEALHALGYPHLVIHGQKSYNGVAIASRQAFEHEERLVWCQKDDCRHIAIRLAGGLEIHNFYVPAGGDKPDIEENEKFAHKLAFLTEMADWAKTSAIKDRKVVLLGDLNVAPLEWDVWNHKRLLRSVGHTPTETAHMERLWQAADLIDVPRQFQPAPEPLYSWWGYRFAPAFAKNYGWRLDHILATPPLADSLAGVTVFRDSRGWEKPSDHVPVILDLA